MRFLCRALCVLAFACLFSSHSRAADYEMAVGAICDTAEQAAMLASLLDTEAPEAALAKVNEDAKNPTACVVGVAIVKEVERGAVVKVGGKNYQVTKVTIFAVRSQYGMQPLSPPGMYYMLFPAEGRPA